MKFYFFIFAFSLMVLTVKSQQHDNFAFNPRKYVCYKASGEITIDGNMNELDWQTADWTEDFIDIEGTLKPAPIYHTRVKMLWDDTYFYVYAQLEEPDIWATYDKHDMVIFHENDFEVFIDPDGDTHLYYELEINALGTVWDLLLAKPYRDGGPAIDAWDITGLKSSVAINGTLNNSADKDSSWSVELAFPWEILEEAAPEGKKPNDGDQWRINFSRVNWRLEKKETGYAKKISPETGKPFPEYNWVWSDQGRIAMHQPETWGFVQFTKQNPGNGVQFIWNEEEVIKWQLRQFYYQQKAYYSIHNKYNPHIGGKNFRNEITERGYLITIKLDTGQWHIREDGKIWKSN